jgi:protocatechuate 3,4-dioxygenase beta subunit
MRASSLLLSLALFAACAPVSAQGPGPPVHADGDASVILCGPDEPGERLIFGGQILDYDGRPLAKAAVTAYHTDASGLYNPNGSGTRVPRIRGVAVTDAEGRFRFSTIMPAAYPNGSEPAHVHLSVMAPAHHVRYVDYWFEGDPHITNGRRATAATNSDIVIVRPGRTPDGWTFSHNVRLLPN